MNNPGLPLDLGSSAQLGHNAPALTRAAFERWYSDAGKWPQSVERNSSGEGYKYAGAASAWTAWKAAAAADQSLRVELLAVLARLCELNATERPMARVWASAKALVDSNTSQGLGA